MPSIVVVLAVRHGGGREPCRVRRVLGPSNQNYPLMCVRTQGYCGAG